MKPPVVKPAHPIPWYRLDNITHCYGGIDHVEAMKS